MKKKKERVNLPKSDMSDLVFKTFDHVHDYMNNYWFAFCVAIWKGCSKFLFSMTVLSDEYRYI